MNKVLGIILFLLILLVGFIFLYFEKVQFSKEVLKLEILAPDTISAGQNIEYTVRYKNNGNTTLEKPELVFEFPQNSISKESQKRIIKTLPDIYPGQENSFTFKGILFGKEGDNLVAKAYLSFQPKNLKARYEVNTSFNTKIQFVPITFEFDLPLKSESNTEINFSLNYFSNSEADLENLAIQIDYPSGFQFIKAKPQGIEQNQWQIPLLKKLNGGRIMISGIISGQEKSQQIFRAKLGIILDNNFIVLKETSQSLEIAQSPVFISYLINGIADYKPQAGELLHYEIFFKNLSQKPVEKKFLLVTLQGDLFDLDTVLVPKGSFAKGDNTILWDWKDVPSLRFLDALEEGKADFWVKLKGIDAIGTNSGTPLLTLKISFGDIQKTFQNSVNSYINFSQKVLRQQDIFDNEGPVPPQIGSSTQYTVLWQIKSGWNGIKNARIKTTLPEYIQLTGKIFPEDAKFTFDQNSREIIWNIGDISPWVGSESSTPLTLAFQIEFTPQESQVGKVVNLLNESEFSGIDAVTGEIIKEKAEGKDSTLPDDNSIDIRGGTIVENNQ
ncbi:MAG: hypothetical protein ACP5H7_01890 [Minisyncoccia bacterium]